MTQTLVRNVKKFLKLKVLINCSFLSMNKQKIIIKKCWLENKKNLITV